MSQSTAFRRALSGLLAIVAVLALTAASCGGDTLTVESEEGEEAAGPADGSQDQVDDDAEPTSTTAEEASPGQDDGMFCESAGAVETTMQTVGTRMTPEELEQTLNDAQDKMTTAVESAPDDIRPEVETNAEAFGLLMDELANAGYSMLDVDLGALDAINSDPRFAQADDVLSLYLFEECGIGTDPALDVGVDGGVDVLVPEGSVRDLLINQFVLAGFTPEEAGCLAEQADPEEVTISGDLPAMTARFEQCGLSLDRLAQLGG